MGDDVEAGKYLWLSGARRADYEQPITLFLHRHARAGREILLAQIPRSFRRIPFNELPPEIRNELTGYGVGSGDFGRKRRSPSQPPAPSRWRDAVIAAIGVGFLFCLMVGALVGLQTIIRWVTRALW